MTGALTGSATQEYSVVVSVLAVATTGDHHGIFTHRVFRQRERESANQ